MRFPLKLLLECSSYVRIPSISGNRLACTLHPSLMWLSFFVTTGSHYT